MNIKRHKNLYKKNWLKLSLAEQLANIGSEIIRAINWKKKGNITYALEANLRALELYDLILSGKFNEASLKEIVRSRELWLDYFLGDNKYNQTSTSWEKYFYGFTYLARNK